MHPIRFAIEALVLLAFTIALYIRAVMSFLRNIRIQTYWAPNETASRGTVMYVNTIGLIRWLCLRMLEFVLLVACAYRWYLRALEPGGENVVRGGGKAIQAKHEKLVALGPRFAFD